MYYVHLDLVVLGLHCIRVPGSYVGQCLVKLVAPNHSFLLAVCRQQHPEIIKHGNVMCITLIRRYLYKESSNG